VSPIGEIYRYRLVGPASYSVMDLKTLQDWVLARRFRAVSGVIDVTGWGAKARPSTSKSISTSSWPTG
jgi:cobalt-zinc-cadmium resistance protein CzcA